jgi:hypothetical protein
MRLGTRASSGAKSRRDGTRSIGARRIARTIIAGCGGAAALSGAALAAARVLSNYREYRALLPSDPSGAEVYLDGVWIWGAGLLFTIVIAAICGVLVLRRP